MLFSILLLVFLVIINGIFSSCELAFLSIDKFKLAKELEKGNKGAKKIKKLIDNSSLFLSTIQIGITLAGFLASAFAADYFADYFLDIFTVNFLSISTFRTILVILITVVLSYFTLVFGELVPKKVAINYPERIAYTFVDFIRIVMYLCFPVAKFLTFSTNVVCKIFKIRDKENKLTEEDIKKMILLGIDEGIVEEKEKDYMFNIFQFNDTEVCNVMKPRKDVVLLNVDDDIKFNISKIKNSKYTRFPVYEGDINNIIGLLNLKDLIMQYKDGKKLNIRNVMREVIKFDSSQKIDDVFRKMQNLHESLAVVFDEKKFVGIVTLEDAIEQIVGNIYDEYN